VKTYFFFPVILGLSLVGFSVAQCPTITIIGPSGVTTVGDKMSFRVEGGAADWKYAWEVSSGVMVAGQGTPVITIATDRSMQGSNLIATVTIDGLPPNCVRAASHMAPIAMALIGDPVDDWSDSLTADEKRSRLDAFFTELANNPNNVGILVIQVTDKERLDERNPRVRLILEHVRFRKFDKRRIWFAFEPGERKRVVVWRMPPSAEVPCDKCKIIKGGDIK
jgi:hypothetical protein